jgi:uncharacterized protein (DUF2249 family)
MIINSETKIAAILKQNPAALDAIVSITPKFEKLRNPLLRKLMAGRTSIGMASKISGCNLTDFFNKLEPLGFEIDNKTVKIIDEEKPGLPSFFNSLKPGQITEFDARPIIDKGEDPLKSIIKNVKNIHPGEALKIINSFEPTPLISLLKNQGFEAYVDKIEDQLIETYFYRTSSGPIEINEKEIIAEDAEDWDAILQKFKDKLQTVDVRQLEMPLPMHTILEALENLPADTALFVYHKRIPVFLLPELAERKFDYRIKEISDGEVHLLIFKN